MKMKKRNIGGSVHGGGFNLAKGRGGRQLSKIYKGISKKDMTNTFKKLDEEKKQKEANPTTTL
jgi:hypothetical protein